MWLEVSDQFHDVHSAVGYVKVITESCAHLVFCKPQN